MTDTDKKLYELLGDKTLSFGGMVKCYVQGHYLHGIVIQQLLDEKFRINPLDDFYGPMDFKEYELEIIGHEPTIADLHRWMNERSYSIQFAQSEQYISIRRRNGACNPIKDYTQIEYDSSKSLLSQSEETKSLIISIITSYS